MRQEKGNSSRQNSAALEGEYALDLELSEDQAQNSVCYPCT